MHTGGEIEGEDRLVALQWDLAQTSACEDPPTMPFSLSPVTSEQRQSHQERKANYLRTRAAAAAVQDKRAGTAQARERAG